MPIQLPPDILIAITAMIAAAAIIFLLITMLVPGKTKRSSTLLAAFGSVGLVIHAVFLNGNPSITRIISSANVIVWGNFTPIFAAILAGAAWIKMPGPVWQRAMSCLALWVVCLYQAYPQLLGAPPTLRPDHWSRGVCPQTTTSTCSAAAAATLLATEQINTTEREMAELCLTRSSGTTGFGIYRGLKIKSGRTVRMLETSLDDLLAMHEPAIISIGLINNDTGHWGPAIGNSHSVVLFGQKSDGKLDIGDPFSGRQTWPRLQLEKVWHGDAFVIEPK